MVQQRQRSDPGGAINLGVGEEPDAPISIAKRGGDVEESNNGAMNAPEIVVDPIDTRHVVDEIRDNVDVPRASWFDVFDWKNIEQVASDTSVAAQKVLPDLLLLDEPRVAPTPPVAIVPIVVDKEVKSPSPVEQGIEVPILDRLSSAVINQTAADRAVSPKPDRSVVGGRRAVRDVIKSKTVVTSRDVLASRFERDNGNHHHHHRSPRLAMAAAAAMKEKAEIMGKPVVAAKDVIASTVERFTRPSSVALGKLFQRDPNAPPPKLISDEFTSASVVSASELRDKPNHKPTPRLLSEEFTADSIISSSELQSMYFAPPSIGGTATSRAVAAAAARPDTTTTDAPVSTPAVVPNKETSLMDDLYCTWSDKGDATAAPEEKVEQTESEPPIEVYEEPIPADEEVVVLEMPEKMEQVADEPTPAVAEPVVAEPISETRDLTPPAEVIEATDDILEQTVETKKAEPCSCLGFDSEDFRGCANPDVGCFQSKDATNYCHSSSAAIANPCQSTVAADADALDNSVASGMPESRPFSWFGNSDGKTAGTCSCLGLDDDDVRTFSSTDAQTNEPTLCCHAPSCCQSTVATTVCCAGAYSTNCCQGSHHTTNLGQSTHASTCCQSTEAAACGPTAQLADLDKEKEKEARPFSWFGSSDEKEDRVQANDPVVEPVESTAVGPRNMMESFFACIDPTYDDYKPLTHALGPVAAYEATEMEPSTLKVDTSAEPFAVDTATLQSESTSPTSTIQTVPTSPIAATGQIETSSNTTTVAAAPDAEALVPSTDKSSSTAASPFSGSLAAPEAVPSTAGSPNTVLSKSLNPVSPITSPSAVLSAGLNVATSLANGLSPIFASSSPKSASNQVPVPIPNATNARTRETVAVFDNVKDEDSIGGNLLDNDLDSVPSVTEDVEDSVAPMQADDLGPPSRPNMNSATLVESKVKKMKLPAEQMAANLDDASTTSASIGVSGKPKIDPSLDARRRLLIKELRSNIATFGRYDVRCANISAALGDLLDEAKDYDHALKLHKDAVTIYSCKLGDDHPTTMDARVRLGAVLENAGEVEEAINNYYQVTVMRRALHGDQDPSVGDGLVSMANALRKKGDYDQAIKELKRALKVFRESLGDSHTKVASTVDEIASLYVTIGNFDKSAAILEEVVKLKAATMGVKSKAVAGTLGQLATAYECSEKFTEAMKALKKSYKIYTEIGGYSNEDATTTLSRMAQLYEATNDHNRAAVAYLGVLRGRKIQRGADHLSVGETYFRLGRALRETKQFDKALKCHKEALPIFVGQGVEMNDVKMVAEIMHEMALISQDRGHFEDATRIFKQELSVRRKIGQPEFPFATRTLKHLGINEYNLKNYSRALKHLVEALTIYKEHGDQGVDCGEILYYTGLVFRKVGNSDRAMDAFVEAVRIFSDHNVDEKDTLLRGANENIKSIEAEIQ